VAEIKKAILVVSFGSSVESARVKAIQKIEELMKRTFDKYQVERAFTSNRIIKKLKETEGIVIDTPEEALQKLIEQGFQEIIIQPLHIIAGYEFDKIKKTIMDNENPNIDIKLGKPLLFEETDYLKVVEALKTQLPEDKEEQVVILIGHGTNHSANECYEKLQEYLSDKRLQVFVGTIEEGVDPMITKLKASKYKEVVLIPFLLVAGDHVQNDLLGDDQHSWKSNLIHNGYAVKAYHKGLGENPAFQDLYIQRVKDLMNE
jgi:sirohydrochlorin cobaltochelatase